jgi:plastocyanin
VPDTTVLRQITLAAIVVALAALSPLSSAPADSKPAAKTYTVLIRGFQFVPQRLEVEAGDTVIWKNEDIVPHTAAARKVFDSKKLDQGHPGVTLPQKREPIPTSVFTTQLWPVSWLSTKPEPNNSQGGMKWKI